jgi:hypothetical protein
VNLLVHLLADYGHSALSYAEENSIPAECVDKIYEDLLTIVRSLRVKAAG